MKFARLLAFGFILFACQPTTLPIVTIIDYRKIITLQTNERSPLAVLNQAGITLNRNDRVLLDGRPIAPDQPIINYPITLQVRRAVTLTLITIGGKTNFQSSAFTVGEALQEASYWLHAGNKIEPSL